MKGNIEFVPECYADTALLKIIFKIPVDKVNHADGIHKVAKAMIAQKENYNKVVVGLVDNDKKNLPRYFDDFITLESDNGILFKKKPNTNHFLIMICPEFEKWILESAKIVNVNPKDYDIPLNPKILHNRTQLINVAKDSKLMDFIKEIKAKKAPSFEKLRNILNRFPAVSGIIT